MSDEDFFNTIKDQDITEGDIVNIQFVPFYETIPYPIEVYICNIKCPYYIEGYVKESVMGVKWKKEKQVIKWAKIFGDKDDEIELEGWQLLIFAQDIISIEKNNNYYKEKSCD